MNRQQGRKVKINIAKISSTFKNYLQHQRRVKMPKFSAEIRWRPSEVVSWNEMLQEQGASLFATIKWRCKQRQEQQPQTELWEANECKAGHHVAESSLAKNNFFCLQNSSLTDVASKNARASCESSRADIQSLLNLKQQQQQNGTRQHQWHFHDRTICIFSSDILNFVWSINLQWQGQYRRKQRSVKKCP